MQGFPHDDLIFGQVLGGEQAAVRALVRQNGLGDVPAIEQIGAFPAQCFQEIGQIGVFIEGVRS